jgi:seryl-tRNA synthetase
MLDIKFIRENPEKVAEGARLKGFKVDVDKLLLVDEERIRLIQEIERIRAEKNKLSDEIARSGGKAKELLSESKTLDKKEEDLKPKLEKLEQGFSTLLEAVPNLPLSEVPVGKSEAENKVLREEGRPRKFDFEVKDHLVLGEGLDILDFETGAKVAGSGFYFLKNEGVLLELALVRYALDFLSKNGFSLWLTPDLARARFYLGTGYQARGPEAQIYEIKDADLGLIATAEVSLAGVHADEILDLNDLPRRYAGYSHCFRQEAGSYGKYSKGLYRVHQFTKVEMFVYAKPEDSPKMHEELLRLEEELWQGLEIPYRVVEMCTGDLGAQAARKFDLEAWMPGRNEWGEVTSTSNTTDFQARRLSARYRKADGKTDFLHTLNGTAIATSRAIVAILENYQQKDGSVKMPDVLVPHLGFSEIKPK